MKTDLCLSPSTAVELVASLKRFPSKKKMGIIINVPGRIVEIIK